LFIICPSLACREGRIGQYLPLPDKESVIYPRPFVRLLISPFARFNYVRSHADQSDILNAKSLLLDGWYSTSQDGLKVYICTRVKKAIVEQAYRQIQTSKGRI
jgi:hypothetical protein